MPASDRDPLFSLAPDRLGTGSEKWDRWPGRDVIPTWVADMDFPAPEVVLDAIRARVDHGVFGYTDMPPGFAPALAEHLAARHGWSIDPAWVTSTPGVVNGLAITARLLAKPGEGIVTFTPVYPPFLSLPGLAGRECIRVPLAQSAAAWTMFMGCSVIITSIGASGAVTASWPEEPRWIDSTVSVSQRAFQSGSQ